MVLLDNDNFLTSLTKIFQQSRTSGTVWLTIKKYNGRTKPRPRKSKAKSASSEPDENLCLLRATNGKKKVSTVVRSKEVTRFQMAYGNLLKAHMDGLKKREKRSTKLPKTATKKSKATQ